MILLLTTYAYSAVAAVAALLALEGYLAVVAGDDSVPSVLIAASAAAGQMTGKLAWYYAGAGSTRLPWLRRTMDKPRWQERFARWEERTRGRPVFTGALLSLSAFAGVPPFMVMSVVAGVLRVPLTLFLGTGLAGRFLRFWVVLEAADWAWLLL